MSLQRVLDLIKDKFLSLINSDRSLVKLFSRLGFLAVFAAIIVTVAPTSAEENSADLTPIVEPIVDTSTIQIETITASPTPTIISIDTSTIGESLTVLSAKDTVTPMSVQPKFKYKIPNTLAVDPRAISKFLPQISFTGSDNVLICVNSNGAKLDIGQKNIDSSGTVGNLIVVGDRTPTLLISGALPGVLNLINSENGLFATSINGGVSNKSLTFEFVAMTAPGVKREFCNAARTSTTVNFTPIGLDIGTIKGEITLK